MKALTRKEAVMMGDENVTPMTREEAILAKQEGLKFFTRDEYLRVNAAKKILDIEVPGVVVGPSDHQQM